MVTAMPAFGADKMAYIFPWGWYDSDSAKTRNPLYRLAARRERVAEDEDARRLSQQCSCTQQSREALAFTCADLARTPPRAGSYLDNTRA